VDGDRADTADAYEDAACGLLTTSMDGVVLAANRTFLRWTGYTATQLAGLRLTDLLTGGGRIYHETHYMPTLRMHGTAREIALDIVAVDGERFPALLNAHTVEDTHGAAARIHVAVFKAVQRREYERELVAANERASHALDDHRRTQHALVREQARVALIADASEALLSTMEPSAAIDRMLEVIVDHVAVWATVFLVVDDEPVQVYLQHRDASRMDVVRSHLVDPAALLADMPLTRQVLDGRRRAVVTTAEESALAGRATGARAAMFRALGTGPAIIVPLRDDGIIGALAIIGPPERAEFDVVDVALARDLAQRATVTFRHGRAFERERRNAHELQRSLLPRLLPLPGLTADTAYVAASAGAEIGGDWYDLVQGDDRIVASIGDITGHSMAAAATMARVQAALRIFAHEGAGPAAMLERADSNAPVLLGDRQASCQIVQLTKESDANWTALLASAGHPYPLLATPDGEVQVIETIRDPLLGLGIQPRRTAKRMHIAPGSIMVFYTDGLIEHRNRSLTDGYEALAGALAREAPNGITGLASRLVDALEPSGHDDIACLALHLP
jgi:PAS domain S-box-containing protein